MEREITVKSVKKLSRHDLEVLVLSLYNELARQEPTLTNALEDTRTKHQ